MFKEYMNPDWLNSVVNKMSKTHINLPITLLSQQCELLERGTTASPDLLGELAGYTNLVAVLMDANSFSSQRLSFYENYLCNQRVVFTEIGEKTMRKISLISTEKFNDLAKQELSLVMGIITRLHRNYGYRVKFLCEELYCGFKLDIARYAKKQVVELLAIDTGSSF